MTNQTAVKLEVQAREEAKNPRQLRAAGFLPITVYGKGVESKSLQINAHEFKLAYRDNKEATFELTFGAEKMSTIVKDVQMNYSINQALNVEFCLV